VARLVPKLLARWLTAMFNMVDANIGPKATRATTQAVFDTEFWLLRSAWAGAVLAD
jgi:hypothetical protein